MFREKETFLLKVLDVAAAETDPVLVPAGLGGGPVAMPDAGEEEEIVPGAIVRRPGGTRFELTLAAGNVDDLDIRGACGRGPR